MNNDEIGVFSTLAIGPGLGGDPAAIMSRENEDRQFLTPQMGVAALYGDVYGNELQKDVKRYAGTALIGGASILNITGEHLASVNPLTGLVDNKITADAAGLTFGIPTIEGHNYYSRALYEPVFSGFMTWIWNVLGLK